MRAQLEVGADCEFKVGSGLGGWRPGTVVSIEDRVYTVREPRGQEHELAPRHVRAPRSSKPARRIAKLPAPPSVDVVRSVPAPKRFTVRPAAEQIARAVASAPPLRDPVYLDFVRSQPCCVCRAPAPSDPHHFGLRGMGQKTDDSRVVPLCRRCHDTFHQSGSPDGRTRTATRLIFAEAMVDLLTADRKREALGARGQS